MNANRWLLAGIAVLAVMVILAGRWLWQDTGADIVATPEQGAGLPALGDSRAPSLPPSGVVPPPALPAQDSPLPAVPEATADAAETMAEALKHGDPQAPRVVREAAQEAPTPAELADPKAYQQYEARQNQRLYNQYVKAADSEIPRLQADIQRARDAGLTPEQIAEGEEKLRRIQAMRDQLQAQHPDAR